MWHRKWKDVLPTITMEHLWKRTTPIVRMITAAAVVVIIGSLVYGYWASPERWSQVAQPLLSLASALLFFVALIMQMREHELGMEEMRRATENHAQTLGVSKQEKEFNVCHTAAAALVSELNGFWFKDDHHHVLVYDPLQYSGASAIEAMTRAWVRRIEQRMSKLMDAPEFANTNFRGFHQTSLEVQTLYDLNLRTFWMQAALKKKSLDSWDRDYLTTLAWPVMKRVCEAQDDNIRKCISHLDEISQRDGIALENIGTNLPEVKELRRQLDAILGLRNQDFSPIEERRPVV